MSRATSSAMVGTIWKALAPVPITATRLPASSVPSIHSAECIEAPANVSRPGMSGSFGRLSWPTALITTSASMSSVAVPSARRTGRTTAPSRPATGPGPPRYSNRTWSAMPKSCMHWSK